MSAVFSDYILRGRHKKRRGRGGKNEREKKEGALAKHYVVGVYCLKNSET